MEQKTHKTFTIRIPIEAHQAFKELQERFMVKYRRKPSLVETIGLAGIQLNNSLKAKNKKAN